MKDANVCMGLWRAETCLQDAESLLQVAAEILGGVSGDLSEDLDRAQSLVRVTRARLSQGR